ncbi:hypothetical protein BGX20_006150, partial [Mortierella sp. AD010]
MVSPYRTAQSVITDFFPSIPSPADPHSIVSASPANPHSIISSSVGSSAVSQQTYRSPHSIVPTSDTGLSSSIRSPQIVSPQTDKSSREQVNHDTQVLAGSPAVWSQSTHIYSPPPPPQYDEKQQQPQQQQQQQQQYQSHPMQPVHAALNRDSDRSATPLSAQTEVIGNKPTWKKKRKWLWAFVIFTIIVAVVLGIVFGVVLKKDNDSSNNSNTPLPIGMANGSTPTTS